MANLKHKSASVLIGIVLTLMVFQDVKAALKTNFIEDICYNQKSVVIDLRYEPTGILMSIPRTESSQLFDCEVILKPPSESSVVVSIYRYDIGSDDLLTIEDSDRFKIALKGYSHFKDEKKAIISEGKTAIRYRREITETSHPRQGFQFTYTAVKKQGPCYDNEFQCNNRLCILKEYVCDGHNHCGDGSDQKTCVPKNELISNANRDVNINKSYPNANIIWISVIGAAGVVVFIIVIVFIVVVVRRPNTRKPKTITAQNSNNLNSGGNAPLQSVSSTVPQQTPATDGVPSAPPAPEHEGFSFYNRVRRSLRGLKNPTTENASKEIVTSEVYQVPSMYPNLDDREPTSLEGGIENPEFKIEES